MLLNIDMKALQQYLFPITQICSPQGDKLLSLGQLSSFAALKNHGILERGLGELNSLKILNITYKEWQLSKNGQNLIEKSLRY